MQQLEERGLEQGFTFNGKTKVIEGNFSLPSESPVYSTALARKEGLFLLKTIALEMGWEGRRMPAEAPSLLCSGSG